MKRLDRRFAFRGVAVLLFLSACVGCESDVSVITWFGAYRVEGVPYIVAATTAPHTGSSRFSIFCPRDRTSGGDPTRILSQWTKQTGECLGPIYGAFVWRDASGQEELGVIHHKRVTFFSFRPPKEHDEADEEKGRDASEAPRPSPVQQDEEPENAEEAERDGDGAQTQSERGFESDFGFVTTALPSPAYAPNQLWETQSRQMLMPFAWLAEAGEMLNGKLYLFGREGTEKPKETSAPIGRLRAAVYDGKDWKELSLKGPELTGTQFYLSAVRHAGRIHLFYREVSDADATPLSPLEITFDGRSFAETPRRLDKLPQGGVQFWSDGFSLRAVVQPPSRTPFTNEPFQIWRIPTDNANFPDKPSEIIERSRTRRSPLFPSYRMARGVYRGGYEGFGGTEFFLRSNTQSMELWVRAGEGASAWTVFSGSQLLGLPHYRLGLVFAGVLAACLALIAFGAGLAWRQRRLWRPEGKLKPHEVYGSLGLRGAAYLCDYLILWALWLPLEQLGQFPEILSNRTLWLLNQPPAFFMTYLLYFSLFEWLWNATPGKLLMGLRIIRESGERPNLWAAVVRNVIGFFERQPQTLPLAAFAVMLTSRRQRIGDLPVKTLVVQYSMLEAIRKRRLGGILPFGRGVPATEPPMDDWDDRPSRKKYDDFDDEYDDLDDEDYDDDELDDDEFDDEYDDLDDEDLAEVLDEDIPDEGKLPDKSLESDEARWEKLKESLRAIGEEARKNAEREKAEKAGESAQNPDELKDEKKPPAGSDG